MLFLMRRNHFQKKKKIKEKEQILSAHAFLFQKRFLYIFYPYSDTKLFY